MSKTWRILCRRCGRPLKDPHSIDAGIGPTCAARESGRYRKAGAKQDTETLDMFDEKEEQQDGKD